MTTNDKLYNIVDISGWEKGFKEYRASGVYETRPRVVDKHGNEYVSKHCKPLTRINELIITKACLKAGFDAVNNDLAYDKETKKASIISPMLEYGLDPLDRNINPFFKVHNALTIRLDAFFKEHPQFNDKFKERFVDEVLLRILIEDQDSQFSRNISVKTKKYHNHSESSPLCVIQPLELSTSYDFNYGLRRALGARGHSNQGAIAKNLEFIAQHYPKKAEQFFANFSFDNATMDQLFDLSGAPLEWYLMQRQQDPHGIPNLTTTLLTEDINNLSKSTRQQYEENLAFMKNISARKATFQLNNATLQKEGQIQ